MTFRSFFAVALLSSAFFASLAQAKPAYLGLITSHYPGSKTPQALKCATCHDGGVKLNPFGQDFSKVVIRGDQTDAGYQALGALDSDGDGISNLDELMSGTRPGKKEN